MEKHTSREIVDMLQKHTYDKELDHQNKRIKMIASRSFIMNNTEASGLDGAHVCQENMNSSSSSTVVARKHLFDKALTPNNVGELNCLVILM